MVKRMFDIFCSSIASVVFGPLTLLIAVLVRLDSPGDAIFRQRRAGWRGKPFVMLKFRTMRTDVDPYGVSPHQAEDPRMTKVGRFLRETSLDELPQLWNVLCGTMSLVGPRPLYERQAAQWDSRQRRRLDVRPGITGYAQVIGRASIALEEKIELDLYYVDHQSLRLDLWILWKTIQGALAREKDIYEQRYSRDRLYEHDTPDVPEGSGGGIGNVKPFQRHV